LTEPQWWELRRRVASSSPRTYRCPFCNRLLHAMSDHVLIAPEGDVNRRRHAHVQCVQAARLPGPPRRPGLLARAATLLRPKRP